jgi:hypothetical protein
MLSIRQLLPPARMAFAADRSFYFRFRKCWNVFDSRILIPCLLKFVMGILHTTWAPALCQYCAAPPFLIVVAL